MATLLIDKRSIDMRKAPYVKTALQSLGDVFDTPEFLVLYYVCDVKRVDNAVNVWLLTTVGPFD